ncbi:MAG: acyl-CoA dehydrogenase family protein [Nitrospinae bacterium]|nr:acyl-CoA dehydrogenase family protein [Nitrospinota bacterium]
MLNLSFSEDQELFRQMVREFAQTELAPGYLERAKREEAPREEFRKMAELGLTGINIPEEYGGQGADYVTIGIAIEEIARADINCSYPIAVGGLGGGAFLKHGTPEQRETWLPKITRGETLLGLALTEPGCGSDAAAMKTTALREGDGYVLNGEKSSISFVNCATDFFLFAKTDPKAGARGVSCFLVPMDAPGLTTSIFHDMGCKPIGRGALALKEVHIPASSLMGQEGRGFHLVMEEFDYTKVLIGLMCLGTAQAALEDAIAYAKERKAFGKPIARFEGVSFLIAEHATRMEAARLLCYQALWLRDQGKPHTKEASMCKWWVPKISAEAIHDALLIHGHLGYSDEYPLEQRWRDVLAFQIADGTAQIQKIIISREILGREYLPY